MNPLGMEYTDVTLDLSPLLVLYHKSPKNNLNYTGLDQNVFLEKHETSLLQQMNRMREENPEGSFCDVSFDINGKEFHCHKAVLVSASPYFKTMFNGAYRESNACRKITLKEIEPEALAEILKAIYTCRFHLDRTNAYYILRASHMLLLTDIFDAVISWVTADPDIDYLIETCIFARQVEYTSLYNKCIAAIASDLINLSKTIAFDSKVSFEVFKEILSHELLINEDKELFHLIARWCKSNECVEDRVLILLNSANMKSGCLSTSMMAKFIVNSYGEIDRKIPSTTTTAEASRKKGERGRKRRTDVNYNIYLNTVDVETGAKGWGFLQSNNEFDEFKALYHEHSNAGYRKVKQIGNKLYCFEHNDRLKLNRFYSLEAGQKKYLKLPTTNYNNHINTKYFDVEVMDDFIYLISESGELWKYNIENDTWSSVQLEQLPAGITPHSPPPSEYISFGACYRQISSTSSYSNKRSFSESFILSPKLTAHHGSLYIVGLEEGDIIRIHPNQSRHFHKIRFPCSHKVANPAVCSFIQKLVVSGSNHDGNLHKTVSMFDMVAEKWLEVEDMNIARANHSLSFHGGFLYAVENKHMVPNEKYDTKLGKWMNFPSIPERISTVQNGKRIDLATGDVFNFSIV